MNDNGSFFIEFTADGLAHSSEGAGDGIWSAFTICDALYDSKKGETIVIDEPEPSLHPSLQKKMLSLLLDQARKKQIVISTHSPYFVSWPALLNGAILWRTAKSAAQGIEAFQLEIDSSFRGFMSNLSNPHTLGMVANEVFFVEDNLILVEGQEDVVILEKISNEIGEPFHGNFFGWGAGGAGNMKHFLNLFQSLGYRKVVALYDGDKVHECEESKRLFPKYKVMHLKEDDIRDKEASQTYAKTGIVDVHGKLKLENKKYMLDFIKQVNFYFEEAEPNQS